MAANWNKPGSDGPEPPWVRLVRPAFIAILTLLFLWLALSMKRHHFLDGARYNNRNGGTHP
jgi:hypothetical protein